MPREIRRVTLSHGYERQMRLLRASMDDTLMRMALLQRIRVDWVEIPSGTLIRGTPSEAVDGLVAAHASIGVERGWLLKEAPRAEVTVQRFAMARTPVTVSEWREFALDVNCSMHGNSGAPDHPVDGIPWADANRFCAWASEQLQASVRLPTESEWERAARGGDAREYPWGDRYEPGLANLADLGRGAALPVGSFPRAASPFGVLDLVGNVDEWTSTVYAPYAGAPAEVPQVESWAVDPHVTRGGGFIHNRDLARCARRHGLYAPMQGAGLRLVRDI